MSTPTVALPADLTYGFVVGAYLLAVGDSAADPDRYPDGRPASALAVTFTPSQTMHRLVGADPVTVLRAPLVCEVGSDGLLREKGASAAGVWLVSGVYKVAFSGVSSHAMPPPFEILVTPDHTVSSPLNLALASPYVPDPAAPVTLMQVVGTPVIGSVVGVDDSGTLTYLPPATGSETLILEAGEPVPADTADGTLVFRKT